MKFYSVFSAYTLRNIKLTKSTVYCKDTNFTKNSKHIFPEKALRGHRPNSYIHVSVSNLYVPTIGLHILQENR
jgi:hypothetical protein